MNRRLFTILVSAFIIAALCSFLVFKIVSRHVAAPVARVTHVVAAATDLKIGSIIKPSDLTTISIVGTLPQGAILNPKDAIGRGVISEISPGEAIVNSRLAAPGSGGGLAATIPQGMRAAAVKVDQVVGVAGFATPGMRVDVIVSGNPPGQRNGPQGTITKTLLQNIEVLSAGTDIQRDATGKPKQVQVVNLLVTPEQAELLSLAANETHIQLVLRNPLDTTIAKPPATSMAQIFAPSGQAPAPQATPVRSYQPVRRAPAVYQVQIYNGAKRSEAKFPASGEKQ